MNDFDIFLQSLSTLFTVLAPGLAGLLLANIFLTVIRRFADKKNSYFGHRVIYYLKMPILIFVPMLCIHITLSGLDLGGEWISAIQGISYLILLGLLAWLVIKSLDLLSDMIAHNYNISIDDNLKERKILTQLLYLRRVGAVVTTLFFLAIGLMEFEQAKELGVGLITSAGITGIILGFAAQKSLANLLAGFQIAFTQPIRLDDVVVVEGEWGRIEEITLTYIVVKIWDKRRLVLPITYFINQPFQNWTRESAEILGTVYLYVDYAMPVQVLRDALHRILEQTDLWDGQIGQVVVTDSTERSKQVRILVSAKDGSTAWDLRCYVREHIIDFIQKEYPTYLPQVRVESATSGHISLYN
ncbi:MAG: mechanosensitive ion channel domain-containing protein [Bacteroidota bacterium]